VSIQAIISSLLTVGAFQLGSLLLSTSSTLDHRNKSNGIMDSQYGMECNSPVKGFIDEPNFSGSVGTAYTRVEFIGSGPSNYHYYSRGQGGMASTGSRFRPLMRDAMYVFLIVIAGTDEKGYSALGTGRCVLYSAHLFIRLDNRFFNASKSRYVK